MREGLCSLPAKRAHIRFVELQYRIAICSSMWLLPSCSGSECQSFSSDPHRCNLAHRCRRYLPIQCTASPPNHRQSTELDNRVLAQFPMTRLWCCPQLSLRVAYSNRATSKFYLGAVQCKGGRFDGIQWAFRSSSAILD